MPNPIPLRMYTKFELRCLLTDPAVELNRLPQNFKPMAVETFNNQVHPLFDEHELTAYKRMKMLPIKLVRLILQDAGLTPINE